MGVETKSDIKLKSYRILISTEFRTLVYIFDFCSRNQSVLLSKGRGRVTISWWWKDLCFHIVTFSKCNELTFKRHENTTNSFILIANVRISVKEEEEVGDLLLSGERVRGMKRRIVQIDWALQLDAKWNWTRWEVETSMCPLFLWLSQQTRRVHNQKKFHNDSWFFMTTAYGMF